MKKYRILQIHNFYQIPGGEDVVVRNEKRLLEEHGHQVYTYYRTNKELQERGIFGKLLLPFTAVYSFRTKREVERMIRENGIDIVHVHNTLTMVSPSVFYAAFKCKVPVVQTLHNFRMLCPAGSFFRDNVICEECVARGMGCAIRHKCYRNSTLQTIVSAAILKIHRMLGTYRKVNFICLTEFNRNKLLDSLDTRRRTVDPARVYIKPNFTFAEGIVPSESKVEEEYFLFAGRVEALKGIDIAIRAFEQLPDEMLYVAGSGPMMEEMQEYVKAHNMQNVKFLGYLQKDEMSERFYHAKAVIMTSQCYEAFAMTIAEAYSYGVPVIAGRVGNMDGMVKNGVTGVKFTYNSAEDLAEKVREFNKMDLGVLKENAREFYETRLRPEDNYQKLMEIYEDISK
ncbi:MAG: glycosyltransferase family 4 protein [Clostridiales bacterium]|nr:glycosyltransferase family 4 protein [Roseburia sp.]MDD7637304.1 glycosyltransferase family 4 protein [Clostridiales bacterium]MDY4111533.1 glycosyltransferase family 4 protein [Roseburia sp.]